MYYKILDKRIQPEWMKPSTRYAAGVDLRAVLDQPLYIGSGERHRIHTGIAVALPEETMGDVSPRSGWGQRGLVLSNLAGKIDEDYRGEIILAVWNTNGTYERPLCIMPFDRIAQLIVHDIRRADQWVQVDDLGETERGNKGFGSTGY